MVDSIPVTDSTDETQEIAVVSIGGKLYPVHVLADQNGNLVTASNPLQVAGLGVRDSTGVMIVPADMATTNQTFDADGNVLTTTISDGTTSWVRTITRDGSGRVIAISKWVRQ